MSEEATKVPVKSEEIAPEDKATSVQAWRPLGSLRREIDRLFEDFDRDSWRSPFRRSVFELEPFWQRALPWGGVPAVDIVERDSAFEVTAELPGLDEKDVEVKLSDVGLTIKGEKRQEKEERKKGYHVQERHYGAFERTFRIPEGVDADKIEAIFKKGVLTLTLPKKPEAQKPAKKIEVKAD
jgi:HSP20 family protein